MKIRNCPKCNTLIHYKSKASYKIAEVKDTKCKECRKLTVQVKLYNRALKASKLKLFDFDLTVDYIKGILDSQRIRNKSLGHNIHVICAYTGNVLPFKRISIDRIDSNKGYIQGNIHFVDIRCNIGKNKFKEEDYIQDCIDVANKHSTITDKVNNFLLKTKLKYE